MPNPLSITFETSLADTLDILILPTDQSGDLPKSAVKIWAQTGLEFDRLADAAAFTGKKGQFLEVLGPTLEGTSAKRLWVVGMSSQGTGDDNEEDGQKAEQPTPADPREWAKAGGAIFGRAQAAKAKSIGIIASDTDLSFEQLADLAGGMVLRNDRFDRYKSKKTAAPDEQDDDDMQITFAVSDPKTATKAFELQNAEVQGTLLARELVHLPPNDLGPAEFAQYVRDLAEFGLDIEILNRDDMSKLGMNALLGVAQGSIREPYLAIMKWNGGKKGDAPFAIVGKGVCFDSGGISIKPAGSMEDMKGDMGGAAAVVGTMKTLALRKAACNVVGVIGLVENMPSGTAYRPGDIIRAMSGTTIEVINTDAEGRMVLADALWYTQDRFKPSAMVNLATLTGAILVALGQDHAGLFSNNDDLATALFAAGQTSGEKVWRMPIGPAYDKLIESRFADIKNTGGRFGGAITAAQFLQRFVNNVPWAHLDIAGMAFSVTPTETNRNWAPGFGVGLLNQYIKDQIESAE